MIKTVIFDFDGTIADTLTTIVKLFNLRAKDFDLSPITKKELEEYRNKSPFEIIKEFGIALIKLPFIAAKIRGELNKEITNVKLFAKVRKVLDTLKDRRFHLGILSSNSKENIEKFLQANSLEIFDFIHSEENILGKGKALGNLLKTHRLKNNEVIYVGDEVRDIEACKENGVKIISVTWGFNKKDILKKSKPDYIVDKPRKILKILS
ncbi:hypothetical protein A3A46_04425 [Candidatus Roizmanbacteria bacterium RIFCSPLOWO2_01_FULL_37_13]|uniref:Carotenoid oxygenase n=1 Tax=Candidatus Roizmanbacteria bacterium RIFCSPHIGHO2_02_FULL_38_11 TaxID=1802039 RepID=A0A1F7GXG6_9BACT|nr:MAG: hypothetical protein A3C25_05635 [Candidatus Roizmanbacteria bacterium RIFCSPHIGHO2_02_FULL_38_11]OGK34186.1 MAG: hypothetical protein A3F58_00410 [Candidatus Roizmanbacteria bacterium RIFCSPHIGHO2_12_FULL_37_9b]OGK43022.1 MAG: hypothetical protein A3A46_04425 [Candidatus Roizmanbacteria bacterium RIFCSPLOWO2_01_FULL_37_13]